MQRLNRGISRTFTAAACFNAFLMPYIRLIVLVLILSAAAVAKAQQPNRPGPGPSTEVSAQNSDSVMVTVVLKHQKDKNLPEIRRILEKQGFWDVFPPEDARVVSWNIAMGLGHIITLVIPAGSVRFLNVAIENTAWGAFDTEFYLSYDYLGIWQDYMTRRTDARTDRD